MSDPHNPLRSFVLHLAARQAVFLGAFAALFLLPHLLLGQSLLLPLALLACGVVSALVDLHSLDLVPTAFPTEQARQTARVLAVGLGVLVGFLCLTSAATPGRCLFQAGLVLVLRAAAPLALGLFAYPSFRDDVFPLLEKLGAGTPAFREALRERAALKGVEHRQRQDRQAAVLDARARVVAHYREHRRLLQARFNPTWVETEIKARIPDGAGEQEAYAAASQLIAQFNKCLAERRERADQLERQLAELRTRRAATAGNAHLDEEVRQEELAAIDRRERELLAQRAELARAA